MSSRNLLHLLREVRAGTRSIQEAAHQLSHHEKQVEQLGFSTLDLQRERRIGFPEVIYGEGKTLPQLRTIFEQLLVHHALIFATRVNNEKGEALQQLLPGIQYDPCARIAYWQRKGHHPPVTLGKIAVLSAGTSDLPVAEEAALTAQLLGLDVIRIYDVGVAGLHRLIRALPQVEPVHVVIVVAGMEGALPSVVAGLIDKPIIAVPTSIGYGAHLQGVATLLSMLNSCSSGISVVNIDNGFGAAYQAALITRLLAPSSPVEREEMEDESSTF